VPDVAGELVPVEHPLDLLLVESDVDARRVRVA